MQTVYKQMSGGSFEFWTYCDGQRVFISANTANKLISQGERLVAL